MIKGITKELLKREYLGNKRTIKEISDELSCNYHTVLRKMVKYSIPRRKGSIKGSFKHSIEFKERLSRQRMGSKNPAWRGSNVSYKALHGWLRRNKPTVDNCEDCGSDKKLEISNISGEYNRDLNNHKWLCISCHRKVDYTEAGRERMKKNYVFRAIDVKGRYMKGL